MGAGRRFWLNLQSRYELEVEVRSICNGDIASTYQIESSVTTDALFSADCDVVQAGRTRGSVVATGVTFEIPEVHRWTIREGRAVAAHFSIDTPAMLAALTAG